MLRFPVLKNPANSTPDPVTNCLNGKTNYCFEFRRKCGMFMLGVVFLRCLNFRLFKQGFLTKLSVPS